MKRYILTLIILSLSVSATWAQKEFLIFDLGTLSDPPQNSTSWGVRNEDYDFKELDVSLNFDIQQKALVKLEIDYFGIREPDSTKLVSITNKQTQEAIKTYAQEVEIWSCDAKNSIISFVVEPGEYEIKMHSPATVYPTQTTDPAFYVIISARFNNIPYVPIDPEIPTVPEIPTEPAKPAIPSSPTSPGDGITIPKLPSGESLSLTVNYTYNIRSWTKSISSPLFTETLYYNEEKDGNIPQWNGNVSRMEWESVKNDKMQQRIYNFGYDALSRLKSAAYAGAGNEQYSSNYSYDKHGNMLSLQRFGKVAPSIYGIVDKIEMTYNGNQLVKATDAAIDPLISESMDFKDYSSGNGLYEYNTNGAMIKDLHKGISQIKYNSLNLPEWIDIKNPQAEGRNEYLYSAGGVKLRVTQRWNSNYQSNPIIGTDVNESSLDEQRVTDYVGNKIYEDGQLVKILVDGGYYDMRDQKYYFYLQDHLGNNRVVADADGNIKQTNHYYPFGGSFADGEGQEVQDYKYNGKELDRTHGLNMYDYSARYMEPAIGRFTSVDPLAEEYYSWSPYLYVMNNPLRYTDPTGMSANDTLNVYLPPVVKEADAPKSGTSLPALESAPTYNLVPYYGRPVMYGTIEHLPLPGPGNLKSLLQALKSIPSAVKNLGSLFKTAKSFKSAKDLINSVERLERLKGGVKQGKIIGKGSAIKILRDIAKEQGATIQTKGTEKFFQSGNIRVGVHTSTRGGTETIHINDAGQLYKIRIIP